MTPATLAALTLQKGSLLCVALDPSEEAFGKALPIQQAESLLLNIIEQTAPHAVAYKLNTAFYERWGEKGWALMRRIRAALPTDSLSIADAKRGDIAHTNRYYAKALYEDLGFDAVTVHPYLGWEALSPFLDYPGKWVFVLLRTTEAPTWQASVWRTIVETAPLDTPATIGWVWGAHHTAALPELRAKRPNDWLLMPGLGAQGACVESTAPIYPALVVVGRALLQAPKNAAAWSAQTASLLPTSEATGRFELP